MRNRAVYTPVGAVLHHAGIEISVRRPKGYKGNPRTLFLLPPDAFAIISAAASIDPEMGRLLTFLLYTGCRIGEALALKWERVSLDDRLAYIETSKNDDPRTVKLRPEICHLLEPHRRPPVRCFDSTKADTGILFFSMPRSRLAVCRPSKTEARRANANPALSLFLGDVPHVLPHLGDVDAPLWWRRRSRPGRNRPLARSAISRALHAHRGA